MEEKTVIVRRINPFSLLISRISSLIWLVIGLIMLLLAVRIVFLLLGVANTGFVTWIYQTSDFFVAPFVGIFPSTTYNGSFFDAAALIALALFGVLGIVISSILSFFGRD